MAIIISDKVYFRGKKISRGREGHYVMTKLSVSQEDIAILNVYLPNNRVAIFMKQNPIELKGEINRSTIIVERFQHPLLTINITTRQEISKDIAELTNTIKQQDLPLLLC